MEKLLYEWHLGIIALAPAVTFSAASCSKSTSESSAPVVPKQKMPEDKSETPPVEETEKENPIEVEETEKESPVEEYTPIPYPPGHPIYGHPPVNKEKGEETTDIESTETDQNW